MCGLIYGRSLDGHAIHKRLVRRYRAQKTRGTQGFGFIALTNSTVSHYERAEREDKIQQALAATGSAEVLFHHRFPTSGPNLPETAHPLRIKHKSLPSIYYVAHNGVITNCHTLRTEHEALGFRYTTVTREITSYHVGKKRYPKKTSEESFNDSESFAIDLARYLAGAQTSIKAQGSIAFLCLETTKQGKAIALWYGRNTNPLKAERTAQSFFLASEGAGIDIPAHTLHRFDYQTGENTTKAVTFPSYHHYDYGSNYRYPALPATPSPWRADERQPIGFRNEPNRLPLASPDDPPVTIVTAESLYEEYQDLEGKIEELEWEYDWYRDSNSAPEAEATLQELRKLRAQLANLADELAIIEAETTTGHGTP